jgi:hypothetical protein
MSDQQHTPEWRSERLGKITASRIDAVLAKPRKGEGSAATRMNYRAQLVMERLTGKEREEFQTWDMKRGLDLEPIARAAYEDRAKVMVEAVGFVQHPTIKMAGCSPDGYISDFGQVQFKVPKAATHFEWIRAGRVPAEHRKQLAFELACTGRQWNDFVSYHPDMPDHLKLFVVRYARENEFIAEIEAEVVKFDKEICELIDELPKVSRSAGSDGRRCCGGDQPVRRSYVPVAKRRWRAEKKQMPVRTYEPLVPAEGIKKWTDEAGHERWKVIDAHEWEAIRETVKARAADKCEGCGTDIGEFDDFHLHHWRGRGGGKRCDCPSHLQLLCQECHDLCHRIGNLRERFVR